MIEDRRMVKFWGDSDDLVQVEGCAGEAEFNVDAAARTGVAFALESEVGAMKVWARFDGTWCFAPSLLDADEPLPPWPLHVRRADNGYSTLLTIAAPTDVRVVRCD